MATRWINLPNVLRDDFTDIHRIDSTYNVGHISQSEISISYSAMVLEIVSIFLHICHFHF